MDLSQLKETAMKDESLSFTARWELDAIAKALPKLESEIKRLECALDEKTGVVQQFKPYPLQEMLRYALTSHDTPEKAKVAATAAYEKSKLLKDENQAIAASNKAILERLVQSIVNAGLPERTSVRRPRSKSKWDTIDTEWRQALGSHIPMYDGWNELERRYNDWLRACDEWRVKIGREESAAIEAKRKKKAEIDKEVWRRQLTYKYDVDTDDATFYDIAQAIIAKDKYLMLGYYLECNRNDWNEGPDFAQTGLRRFPIESQLDKDIYDDISSYIDNWDGDGRIFRDCTWCYSALYDLVQDKTLLEDLQKAREYEN